MKDVLFVSSHLCSGSDALVDALNRDRFEIFRTETVYLHPFDLDYLKNRQHISGDHLLHNTSLASNKFCKLCKSIYVVREAKSTLNLMLQKYSDYSELSALRYYCFRLNRLHQLASRSPGAVFLTGRDLANGLGMDLIEEYLDTKIESSVEWHEEEANSEIDSGILREAQDCYERYLYMFRKLNLLMVS